jgi:hypothetical protein
VPEKGADQAFHAFSPHGRVDGRPIGLSGTRAPGAVHQPVLHCCSDLRYRVSGPILRPELPTAPKLVRHNFEELVTLFGQELCCGRPERCEFLVGEAEDRRQGFRSPL